MNKINQMIRQVFIGCCLLLLPANAVIANNLPVQAELDHFLNDAAQKGFVGIVSLIDQNGSIYHRGLGDAIEGQAIYNENTVIDIASVTKQFTAAAFVKLVEEGKVSPNDTLSTYFINVPDDKKNITLHQLLTHTAGFQSHLGYDDEAISKTTYLTKAFEAPLLQKPGAGYRYSNIGFTIVTAVIEQVTGTTYEDYLYKAFWEPAGLLTTGYFRPDWQRHTVAKRLKPDEGLSSQLDVLRRTDGKAWHLFGNGGILSTASDMLKWHQALAGNAVLSEQAKKTLYSQYVPEDDSGDYFYGYGWSIVPNYHGQKMIWHNGGGPFGRAEFWRFPEQGSAIFVATHTRAIEPYYVAKGIAAILRGEKPEPVKP